MVRPEKIYLHSTVRPVNTSAQKDTFTVDSQSSTYITASQATKHILPPQEES